MERRLRPRPAAIRYRSRPSITALFGRLRGKNLRGNVFTLRPENSKSGLDITPDTTIPLWEAEQMDMGMAIEGLLWLESPPEPPNRPGLD